MRARLYVSAAVAAAVLATAGYFALSDDGDDPGTRWPMPIIVEPRERPAERGANRSPASPSPSPGFAPPPPSARQVPDDDDVGDDDGADDD